MMSQPLPAATPEPAPMPSRKTIRGWLIPLSGRDTLYALLLVVLDVAAFALALGGTIWFDQPLMKLLSGAVAGFFTGRLFILGHDACHQSYTPHRWLNRWIGRITFLPSLTPYSLWEAGHNIVHHGYTNLKGFDFVWAPLTAEEYAALPRWRRALERVYRSGWAPWLYYLVEVWWRRMYFPSEKNMAARRAAFFWDCLLVSAASLLWIGGMIAAAYTSAQPAWLLVAAGVIVPFLVWASMIGFVIYVHHTHTGVAWYDDKSTWTRAQAFVSTTVHLTFRRHVGAALHHIMEHTAHHVDMGIPLYRLRQAQHLLEARLPGRIVIQAFSWRWYFDTARRCKLYNFNLRCWTDFSGRSTSDPVPIPA